MVVILSLLAVAHCTIFYDRAEEILHRHRERHRHGPHYLRFFEQRRTVAMLVEDAETEILADGKGDLIKENPLERRKIVLLVEQQQGHTKSRLQQLLSAQTE